MCIDRGIGGAVDGLAAGVFADCPDYLAGINVPSLPTDPTGGMFGRSDLARALLENVVRMADTLVQRLCQEVPYRGGGVVQPEAGEQRDGSDYDCRLPSCGSAVGCASEADECDDGNTLSEDGCTPACVLEYCGDGVLRVGLEEACDGRNDADGDGCTAGCRVEP